MGHHWLQQLFDLITDGVENLTGIPGWFLDWVDARGVMTVLLGAIALGLAVFVGIRFMQEEFLALADPLVLTAVATSFFAWVGCGALYVTDEDRFYPKVPKERVGHEAARTERTGETE